MGTAMPRSALKKFSCLILSAFALAAAGRTMAAASPAAVSVMTFNIRYDNAADGPDAWPLRRDHVARTILFHDAGIAGLQEALRGQIADLEARLPGYAWLGVGRDDGRDGGEFNPLFYDKERFRVETSGTFWLSETPERPGSRGWDAACNRIVTWARFRPREGGPEFCVFNTHFDHRGETARRESARLLLRRVAGLAAGAPVVVTGDFNADAEEEPCRILTAGTPDGPALLDARGLSATGAYGGATSFNGFSAAPKSGSLIDHIYVRAVAGVRRWGVIAERWDGRPASDHYPVLAEILLPPVR
jgi:endonuclease/exonuclease/phosphatase family metal-dependent hydrolase